MATQCERVGDPWNGAAQGISSGAFEQILAEISFSWGLGKDKALLKREKQREMQSINS